MIQPKSFRSCARLASCVGLVATLLIAAAPAGAALVVDEFSSTVPSWPFTRSTLGSAHRIEQVSSTIFSTPLGFRITELTLSTADVLGMDNVSATIFNTGGYSFLDYSSSTGADGLLKLTYLSTSAWPDSLATVDLTGQGGLRIDFLGFDAPAGGPMTITVKLFDPFGGTNEQSVLVSTAGAQSVTIDLYATPSNLDFSHVSQFEIYFDAPQGADFRVDRLATEVPEPATVGLLTLGLGALLVRRKK